MDEILEKEPELKHINWEEKKFVANGKTYYIQAEGISVGRFSHYEQMISEAVFGVSFDGIFKTLKHIYTLVTTGNETLKALREVGDLAYNQMAAIKDYDETKTNNVLLLCTLFINLSGEDMSEWNMTMARQKIDDWKADNYDMSDFFLFATKLVHGFSEAYMTPFLLEVSNQNEANAKQN